MIQDPFGEHLWRFVRGDLMPREFESWAYRESALAAHLGEALYMQTIETDYADAPQLYTLREAVAGHLQTTPYQCLCVRLRDVDVVDMGSYENHPAFEWTRNWSHQDVFETLERVKSRGDPYWWLWAARCRSCGQGWLIGSEERHNDVFCMRRLVPEELTGIEGQGRWPADFDTYAVLLEIGAHFGRSVTFAEPMKSSLDWTIVMLAKEQPGITIRELCVALGLEPDLAAALARKAVTEHGATITFDEGTSSRISLARRFLAFLKKGMKSRAHSDQSID